MKRYVFKKTFKNIVRTASPCSPSGKTELFYPKPRRNEKAPQMDAGKLAGPLFMSLRAVLQPEALGQSLAVLTRQVRLPILLVQKEQRKDIKCARVRKRNE